MQNEPPSSENTPFEEILRRVHDTPVSSSSPHPASSDFDRPRWRPQPSSTPRPRPVINREPNTRPPISRGWVIVTIVVLIVFICGIVLISQIGKASTSQSTTPTPTSQERLLIGQHIYIGSIKTTKEFKANPSAEYHETLTINCNLLDCFDGSFGGTIYLSENNIDTDIEGNLISDVNSLGFPDRERMQYVINHFGNAGALIQFTNPNYTPCLNCIGWDPKWQFYALVSTDGSLKGIEFSPDHYPSDFHPDGEFSLSLQ